MNKDLLQSRRERAIWSAVIVGCLVFGMTTVLAAEKKAPPALKPPVGPQASIQSSPCDRVDMGTAVTVTVGKSSLLKLQTPITRIVLGNPDQGRAARPIEVE